MKYEHIGWCKEGTHDKVWGIIRLGSNERISFWGRRGAKLQTKYLLGTSAWEADDMFRKKIRKGYKEILEYELDDVYPEFQQDLEKTAVWAMLKL